MARATSRLWLPGQQDCLQASGQAYPQLSALCQHQPASQYTMPWPSVCL